MTTLRTQLRERSPQRCRRGSRRRGAILIVALVITAVLCAMVLSLGTSMRVEVQAAGNRSAAAEASAVERGAEQYVLGLLMDGYGITQRFSEDQFQQVQVGDGTFWVVRPNYDDDSLPLWGVVDEASKININNTNNNTRTMILNLLQDEDTATAISGWRSGNLSTDDEYYLTRPDSAPYQAKHANYETVEELLMVRGVTRELLYGNGTGPQPGQRGNVLMSGNNQTIGGDNLLQSGIYDLMTVSSKEPTAAPDGSQLLRTDRQNQLRQLVQKIGDTTRVNAIVGRFRPNNLPSNVMTLARDGQLSADELDMIADYARPTPPNGQVVRINVNTAPSSVLYSLVGVNGIQSGDIDSLLAARSTAQDIPGALGWVLNAVGVAGAARLGPYITGRSYVYSADIVAFSRNARAFKRCRIIVDASQVPAGGVPQIVYRRDLTDRGCPIPDIMTSLRSGSQVGSVFSARGGIQ